MDYVVYLLLFPENNMYIGITNNISRRTREHKATYGDIFEVETLYSELPFKLACDIETNLISEYRELYGSKLLNKADKGIAPTGSFGELHHASKLSDKQIADVRNRWVKSNGSIKLEVLSKEYGVSSTTMHNILQNKRSYDPKYKPVASSYDSRSKLDVDTIPEIRYTYSQLSPRPTFKDFAINYNVTGAHISRILRGVAYNNLPGPILGKDY